MSDLAAALILGRRFIDEPNSKRKVELLAEALKAEGDRRAAEMRERAARWVEAQLVQPTQAPLLAKAAECIRALPLDPEPST